jgi:hypothetical protein
MPRARSSGKLAAAVTRPRYDKAEFARRGDAAYDRVIGPAVAAGNDGKFVALDIDTGAYEIDPDEQAAADRLTARLPAAQVWVRRVGSRFARRR